VHTSRLAAATVVAAVLGLTAPLAASAAQGPTQRSAVVSRNAADSAKTAHRKPPKNAVLFGLDDHWESNVEADDSQDAARSGIVGTFLAWTRPDMSLATEVRMLIQYSTWANSRGAIPMIDLYPPTSVQLASIASGSQDSVLAAYAKALHKWNHPFLLRLFPEMNGPWESYAPGTNGNTSAELVAAWRHIYRLFHAYGATKVKFVWNPDKWFKGQAASYRSVWPGKRYVDWVGLDLYNNPDRPTTTYPNAQVAAAHSVHEIRRLTKHTPLLVAEIGATSSGKAHWIRTSLSSLSKLGIKAVVWFNEAAPPVNWRLDSSSAALRATRATLAGPKAVWPSHNGGTLARDDRLIVKGHW
jgi:endoglucanase